MSDEILTGMARELRKALLLRGLDPNNPPKDSAPPTARAFGEYRARGGDQYDDAAKFMQALIEEVGK